MAKKRIAGSEPKVTPSALPAATIKLPVPDPVVTTSRPPFNPGGVIIRLQGVIERGERTGRFEYELVAELKGIIETLKKCT